MMKNIAQEQFDIFKEKAPYVADLILEELKSKGVKIFKNVDEARTKAKAAFEFECAGANFFCLRSIAEADNEKIANWILKDLLSSDPAVILFGHREQDDYIPYKAQYLISKGVSFCFVMAPNFASQDANFAIHLAFVPFKESENQGVIGEVRC